MDPEKPVYTKAISSDTPFRYAVVDQFESVEIPYEKDGLSLIVLVPTAEFARTRQDITTTALREVLGKLERSEEKRLVILPCSK
jgi:serine protease inhibitor